MHNLSVILGTGFRTILTMSIGGCAVIAAVILIRAVFGRNHRKLFLLLWAFAAVKLCVPALSSMPVLSVDRYSADPISALILQEQNLSETSATGQYYKELTDTSGNSAYTDVISLIEKRRLTFMEIASLIWAAGILVMISYAIISMMRLHKKTRTSVLQPDSSYLCDYIHDAFIMGILRPRIYLPSSMDPGTRSYALLHERIHLLHKHHLWKALSFLILIVHWFNPFVLIGFILFGRDLEYICDEMVASSLSLSEKSQYTMALISSASSPFSFGAGSLSFGGGIIKKRIRQIFTPKKRTVPGVICMSFLGIAVGACAVTNLTAADRNPYNITEIPSDAVGNVFFNPYEAGFHGGAVWIELRKTDMADSFECRTDQGSFDNNVVTDGSLSLRSKQISAVFSTASDKSEASQWIYWRAMNDNSGSESVSEAVITIRFYKETHPTGYAVIRLFIDKENSVTHDDGSISYLNEYWSELIKCAEFPKVNGQYQRVTDQKLEKLIEKTLDQYNQEPVHSGS